jgi:hypothetical protein
VRKPVWSLLLVATLPGCLLAEPLDGAASSSDDTTAHAGSSAAGSTSRAGAKGETGNSGAPGAGGSNGTSGAPSTDVTAAFLGTWTATSGKLTITCPGTGVAPTDTDVTGDNETWVAGTTTDLVLNGVDGSCDLTASVNGRIATGSPGQSCVDSGTADDGDSYTQTLSFERGMFVVSSSGTTATQTLAGSDVYTDRTQGETLDCVFSETATFEM